MLAGAMPAPHALPITVSEADPLTLRSWAGRPRTTQALALRARIVLAAATHKTPLIRRWLLKRTRRQPPSSFVWTATADEILASVARSCLRTRNSDD